MKSRVLRKAIASLLCVLMVVTLTGCKGGLRDSLSLIKDARNAKQTIARLEQNKNTSKSVGTISNPNNDFNIAVNDFSVKRNSAAGTIDFEWDLLKSDSINDIGIEIFADTKSSGINGISIYAEKDVGEIGSKNLKISSVAKKLDTNTEYYFYIAASGTDGVTRYTDYEYDLDSLVFTESDVRAIYEEELPTQQEQETTTEITNAVQTTSVSNIQASLKDGTISVTWDPVSGCDRYRVMVFPTNGGGKPLSESIATQTEAKVSVASGTAECLIAVATYVDKVIGPYECIYIEGTNSQ